MEAADLEHGSNDELRARIDQIFRADGAKVRATLMRLLGDLDLVEDAAQEAYSAALRRWPVEGLPANPVAWLISAGRFRGIDVKRRDARETGLDESRLLTESDFANEIEVVDDDQLRLIFICCHPDLPEEGRVALTLREVCGLTTEEIAKAFLTPTATVAQRIVRAKAKIKSLRLPWEIPDREALPDRLAGVLRVAYLMFNEGYYASYGYSLLRPLMSREAIRLGRLLCELLPHPEAMGLIALMLLQESRRNARMNSSGDIVLLDDQDRSLWDAGSIAEGVALSNRAMSTDSPGPYAIQSAIAAVHASAATPDASNWREVVRLYDRLLLIVPSPVVELNRAVAVAMLDGPESGLRIVDDLLDQGVLAGYGLAHSARGGLLVRLGRADEARPSYERALDLATQEAERRWLSAQLQALGQKI